MNSSDISKKRFSEYAQYYDLFYENKNYSDESLFIKNLITKYDHRSKEDISILDIGCGTGIHALELMSYGYSVEGTDISSDMIGLAKKRSERAGKSIHFYNESFQSANKINKKYEVVLALFSSINYVLTDADLAESFKNMYDLLNEGGILIFDFWNGDAVVRDYSPTREKTVTSDDIKIIRKTKSSVFKESNNITVDFNFDLFKNDKIIDTFSEKHELRYFFIDEMKSIISRNNFQLINSCPFNEIEKSLDPFDWNVTFVVKKGEN